MIQMLYIQILHVINILPCLLKLPFPKKEMFIFNSFRCHWNVFSIFLKIREDLRYKATLDLSLI